MSNVISLGQQRWVIVPGAMNGRRDLIGIPKPLDEDEGKPRGLKLEPFFEYVGEVTPKPGPAGVTEFKRGFAVRPALALASLRFWPIPADSAMIDVADLSPVEREIIMKGVRVAADLIRQWEEQDRCVAIVKPGDDARPRR